MPRLLFTVACHVLLGGLAWSQDAGQAVEFFETKVRPLLSERCWSCHGTGKQEAGLRLDSSSGLHQGGDFGPVLDADRPRAGRLWQVIQPAAEPSMPPDQPLSAQQRRVLEQWLAAGAPWPDDSSPAKNDDRETTHRGHWAFLPIAKPIPPEVSRVDWPNSSIDAFVLARLETAGLGPSPPVARETWLKRASIDLVGLYPDPEAFGAIAADPREDDLVLAEWTDRLLASPGYGERWGRHWLDVARYADTKDYQDSGEGSYPLAWTYRDYVIQAFNEDLPFDRFVTEQLAADHLESTKNDNQRLAALGFLTVGRRFNHNEQDRIDDQLDTTLRGLMGLTIGCARCHDHKFDPLSIDDYYRLYAVFGNTREPAFPDRPRFHSPLTPASELLDAGVHEQKLREAQAALDARTRELRSAILKEVRDYAGDYLEYIVQQSPEHRTRDDVSLVTQRTTIRDRAAYSQGVVRAWQQFLERCDSEDPELGLFVRLWRGRAADFPSTLATLLQTPDAWNPLLVDRLHSSPPANLAEFAEQIGGFARRRLIDTGASSLCETPKPWPCRIPTGNVGGKSCTGPNRHCVSMTMSSNSSTTSTSSWRSSNWSAMSNKSLSRQKPERLPDRCRWLTASRRANSE